LTERRFKKILVANRGEIALRVMRTCRAMGISTVAVYSDFDSRSPHTRSADEAVHIGPSPAKDSYLNIEKLLDAAKRTSAEAIHPGYGFLSENAEFAEACSSAGITFIGPSPDCIRKMGSKVFAREQMALSKIPVVPGYHTDDQTTENLIKCAEKVGMPVLVKASAGGGGKGMRTIRTLSEIRESIDAARREAEKAFGDGTLFLERFVERARHVEVQIIGDTHGNLVHLFERECSVQRRHQKIIEESPSPALSAETRRQICDAAVKAGREIGYTNAGTVEFVIDSDGQFYFIEVNTRLQVEHPVTEMVTGFDLVRLQIEVAEGRRLQFAQEDVKQKGHAIEARLNAEDTGNGFVPATGVLRDWEYPGDIEGFRIDSGVDSGSEIGIHYDPMLAKVIAHGSDREDARLKLIRGLSELFAAGVTTNREFLIRCAQTEEFASGKYDTAFVERNLEELIASRDTIETSIAAGVLGIYLTKRKQEGSEILPHVPANYRNNPFRDPSIRFESAGSMVDVSWREIAPDTFVVTRGDWQSTVQLVSFDRATLRASIDGIQRAFRVSESGDHFVVQSNSSSIELTRPSRYPRAAGASEHESAYAPMPGQVLKILVEVGQSVAAGDSLVILEAMKMEQTLRATSDGVVESIRVRLGDLVVPGDILVEISASQRD
jgi:propionyl-CoA carboxylase alpha chain